jgi:hypothetical protein
MCDQDKSCKCNVDSYKCEINPFKGSVIVLLDDLEKMVNIKSSLIDDLEFEIDEARNDLRVLEVQRELIFNLLNHPDRIIQASSV